MDFHTPLRNLKNIEMLKVFTSSIICWIPLLLLTIFNRWNNTPPKFLNTSLRIQIYVNIRHCIFNATAKIEAFKHSPNVVSLDTLDHSYVSWNFRSIEEIHLYVRNEPSIHSNAIGGCFFFFFLFFFQTSNTAGILTYNSCTSIMREGGTGRRGCEREGTKRKRKNVAEEAGFERHRGSGQACVQRCVGEGLWGCIGRARDSLPRFSTFERPPRDALCRNEWCTTAWETESNSTEWRSSSGPPTSFRSGDRNETKVPREKFVCDLSVTDAVHPTLSNCFRRCRFFFSFLPRVGCLWPMHRRYAGILEEKLLVIFFERTTVFWTGETLTIELQS